MTDNRTTELRAKLTERGVEYDGRLLYETEWTVNGITWHAKECDGMLNVYVRNNDLMLTPEQAVAATLGSGTCEFNIVEERIPGKRQRSNICECSNCGYRCAYGFIVDERFKCCPGCGRRVER